MLIYLQSIEDPDCRSVFEQVYTEYRGLMFHAARRILGSDQDAEDAVHEAFLKISKNISKISDPVCPKTRAYVVLIVERTSIDLRRKQKRQPAEPLEEDVPGLPAAYDGDNALTRCILSLPARDREIILLRFWQGYSLKETAALLEISEAACRKREQRAKEKLETLCREEAFL